MTLQGCRESAIGRALPAALACLVATLNAACRERPPPPARSSVEVRTPAPDQEPTPLEGTTAHRARVGHGAELVVAPWFRPKKDGYDLLVHFHGMRELQEKNVEQAHLDAAIVSVNLGVGTDPYGAAFRDPKSFTKLLEKVDAELAKSGRSAGARAGDDARQ